MEEKTCYNPIRNEKMNFKFLTCYSGFQDFLHLSFSYQNNFKPLVSSVYVASRIGLR